MDIKSEENIVKKLWKVSLDSKSASDFVKYPISFDWAMKSSDSFDMEYSASFIQEEVKWEYKIWI